MSDLEQYTISDVAQKAGVSVSTVSRVLNGKQDVAKGTRERILSIIEQMGYAPQAQAQRLRAGISRHISLIFPITYPNNMPFNPLDMDFIVGAAAAAGEREFFFSLLTAPMSKRSIRDLYRSSKIDGLVLMQIYADDWRVNLLREGGYPFVMIGHSANNTGLSYIDVDFEASIVMAFDHLVEMNHQNIAFLGHSQELHDKGYGPALRSWTGYQKALAKHHLPAFYGEVSFVGSEVYDMTLDLLDEHPQVTAIVTAHSYATPHILQALHARGKRVPDDCSLIAVTSSRIADMSIPPLTTIDFPSHEMGYRAVRMLIDILTDEMSQPEQILISPQLVIRHSTRSLTDGEK